MTDYKTFRSSPFISYGQNHQNLAFAVNYTDYVHMLFGNISIGFNWGNDKSRTIKHVERDFIYYSKTEWDNSSSGTMMLGNVSKRFDSLKGTINAKCLCFLNKTSIWQNDVSVQFNTNMLQTSVGINSNMCNWLEIDYQLGYNVNSLSFSSAKTSTKLFTQQLHVSITPIEALILTIAAEHYASFFSALPSKQTLFNDIKCSYRYHKIDIIGSLTNVFNQKYYCRTSYSDLSSSYVKYALRGRNILLSFVACF